MLKIKALFSFVLILCLLTGCVNSKDVTPKEIGKIKLDLVKQENTKNGIIYFIKLENNSDLVIKQNNVYLSYPLKTTNGLKSNKYKVEAEGNKLDIKPGEKVSLNVLMPLVDEHNKSLLAVNNPSIQFKGFLETIDSKHLVSIEKELGK